MTDTRETRGAQIAKAGRLSKSGRSIWLVPSQSHQGATYIVDVRPSDPTCTCPDFESRQLACKHVTAVQLRRRKLALPSGLMSTDQPTRATYSQDWALLSVRAKTLVAQQNEVLTKLIAHNLCVLVMSFFELGVQAEFWADEKEPVASTG